MGGRAMKTTVKFLAAALLVGLLVAAYYTYSPRHTPDGQRPLGVVRPESFPELQKIFNDSVGGLRMVALLSPT